MSQQASATRDGPKTVNVSVANGKDAVREPHFFKGDSAKSLSTPAFGVDSGYGGEHAQVVYAEKRACLSALIGGTKTVLQDLVGPTGTVGHTLRYPAHALQKALGPKVAARRVPSNDDVKPPASPVSTAAEPPLDPTPDDLKILQLDMNSYGFKGPKGSVGAKDNALVSQLLESKLADCSQHLDRLHARISDTRSKVLVTGDLNAGKSTFVNAVLRREIVPDDQQPCTALFAEVVDAEQNDGVEEVHGINDPLAYNRLDPSTFTRFDFRHLREVVEDNEEDYELLKVYCKDKRGRSESLLHNGVVDISLIDSPGLNIDSIKTTALFSQQEEIDVIVFVVNAENHFTLSGRDFLTTAGKEKAYIFIVVNRFDQIRRKDRCRRDILEQIRQISPMTYDNADTLVHFVSAKECLNHVEGESTEGTMVPDFHKLEEQLRTFILEKRSRSKLAPAKIYLHNLLVDVATVAQYNTSVAARTAQEIAEEMEDNSPVYDRMLEIKEQVLENIDRTIDDTAAIVQAYTQRELSYFLDHVDAYTDKVEWNGPLYVYQYAKDLRKCVYDMATLRLQRCENHAIAMAKECLEEIKTSAASCMTVPPAIDVGSVAGAFDGDVSSTVSSTPLAVTSSTSGSTSSQALVVQRKEALTMDMAVFIEQIDKKELAREYAPSLGLIVGGLVGYQRMASQMVRNGFNGASSSTGRLVFAGLTIAGVGIFFYVLSDMKNSVERNVVAKMREHFSEVAFLDSNVDRVTRGTRRVLRLAISEFQHQFTRILTENERRRDSQKREIGAAEGAKRFFESMAARAARLVREVDSIDLDVDEKA
ncbi:mitofusin [Thoreauomyces humboldtii]|nr:mitofusin [Thoreauomyces humboldtii]